MSSVSFVSHDAVRSVPGPRVLPVSRATMMFLHVSSVPVFRLVSPPSRRFLSQRCARGLSDLPNQIPLYHAVSSLWSLFLDDNPRCFAAKILNKMVSANGTISCMKSRSYAALRGVMPPAPREYLLTHVTILRVTSKSSQLFADCPSSLSG